MNEKALANSLLDKKENGVSVLSGMQSIWGRLVFRLVLLGGFCFLDSQSGSSTILFLGIGYVVGMTIQDISWFAAIAKSWPFSLKVTDWEKVKEIAGEKS